MSDMLFIRVKLLHENAKEPVYATAGDAGADLYAAEQAEIYPGDWKLVSTGIALELPWGYAGLIHPRSGLAAKHGITVLNAPGTIDAGYRGEVKVNLINHGEDVFKVKSGDRIAQLVIQRIAHATFHPSEELSESERGHGGHGSTGYGIIEKKKGS